MDCLLQLQILGLHCKALSESLRKVSNVIGSQTTLWGIKFLILCAPNMELDTECRTYCFGCPTGGNIGQKFNFTSGTTYLNDFFCILSLPVIWSFPGEGNGNPLQYSCLKNFMGRGAWRRVIIHGVAKCQIRQSDWAQMNKNKMATSKVKRLIRKRQSIFAACIRDRWLLSPIYNKHSEIEE